MQKIITQLRHPHGRGMILGDADVSISAYLSRDSTAAGNAQLRDCNVEEKSIVADDARLFGGGVWHSYVGGSVVVAGDPEIENSIITGRSVTGKASLYHCVTKDFAEVADNVHIDGKSLQEPIVIEGAACVYGSAILDGSFVVGGKMRVCDGRWNGAPKHVDLGYAAVTQSALGALVDCRNRTIDYWIKHGPKLAERWGYTSTQIQELIEAVLDVSHHHVDR